MSSDVLSFESFRSSQDATRSNLLGYLETGTPRGVCFRFSLLRDMPSNPDDYILVSIIDMAARRFVGTQQRFQFEKDSKNAFIFLYTTIASQDLCISVDLISRNNRLETEVYGWTIIPFFSTDYNSLPSIADLNYVQNNCIPLYKGSSALLLSDLNGEGRIERKYGMNYTAFRCKSLHRLRSVLPDSVFFSANDCIPGLALRKVKTNGNSTSVWFPAIGTMEYGPILPIQLAPRLSLLFTNSKILLPPEFEPRLKDSLLKQKEFELGIPSGVLSSMDNSEIRIQKRELLISVHNGYKIVSSTSCPLEFFHKQHNNLLSAVHSLYLRGYSAHPLFAIEVTVLYTVQEPSLWRDSKDGTVSTNASKASATHRKSISKDSSTLIETQSKFDGLYASERTIVIAKSTYVPSVQTDDGTDTQPPQFDIQLQSPCLPFAGYSTVFSSPSAESHIGTLPHSAAAATGSAHRQSPLSLLSTTSADGMQPEYTPFMLPLMSSTPPLAPLALKYTSTRSARSYNAFGTSDPAFVETLGAYLPASGLDSLATVDLGYFSPFSKAPMFCAGVSIEREATPVPPNVDVEVIREPPKPQVAPREEEEERMRQIAEQNRLEEERLRQQQQLEKERAERERLEREERERREEQERQRLEREKREREEQERLAQEAVAREIALREQQEKERLEAEREKMRLAAEEKARAKERERQRLLEEEERRKAAEKRPVSPPPRVETPPPPPPVEDMVSPASFAEEAFDEAGSAITALEDEYQPPQASPYPDRPIAYASMHAPLFSSLRNTEYGPVALGTAFTQAFTLVQALPEFRTKAKELPLASSTLRPFPEQTKDSDGYGYEIPSSILNALQVLGVPQPNYSPYQSPDILLELSDVLPASEVTFYFAAYVHNDIKRSSKDQAPWIEPGIVLPVHSPISHDSAYAIKQSWPYLPSKPLFAAPKRISIGFQFYKNPYVTLGPMKIQSAQYLLQSTIADKSMLHEIGFSLLSLPQKSHSGSSLLGSSTETKISIPTSIFNITPSLLSRSERLEFLEYLLHAQLTIDVWDADTLFSLGQIRVSLLPLFRNQRPTSSDVKAYDVCLSTPTTSSDREFSVLDNSVDTVPTVTGRLYIGMLHRGLPDPHLPMSDSPHAFPTTSALSLPSSNTFAEIAHHPSRPLFAETQPPFGNEPLGWTQTMASQPGYYAASENELRNTRKKVVAKKRGSAQPPGDTYVSQSVQEPLVPFAIEDKEAVTALSPYTSQLTSTLSWVQANEYGLALTPTALSSGSTKHYQPTVNSGQPTILPLQFRNPHPYAVTYTLSMFQTFALSQPIPVSNNATPIQVCAPLQTTRLLLDPGQFSTYSHLLNDAATKVNLPILLGTELRRFKSSEASLPMVLSSSSNRDSSDALALEYTIVVGAGETVTLPVFSYFFYKEPLPQPGQNGHQQSISPHPALQCNTASTTVNPYKPSYLPIPENMTLWFKLQVQQTGEVVQTMTIQPQILPPVVHRQIVVHRHALPHNVPIELLLPTLCGGRGWSGTQRSGRLPLPYDTFGSFASDCVTAFSPCAVPYGTYAQGTNLLLEQEGQRLYFHTPEDSGRSAYSFPLYLYKDSKMMQLDTVWDVSVLTVQTLHFAFRKQFMIPSKVVCNPLLEAVPMLEDKPSPPAQTGASSLVASNRPYPTASHPPSSYFRGNDAQHVDKSVRKRVVSTSSSIVSFGREEFTAPSGACTVLPISVRAKPTFLPSTGQIHAFLHSLILPNNSSQDSSSTLPMHSTEAKGKPTKTVETSMLGEVWHIHADFASIWSSHLQFRLNFPLGMPTTAVLRIENSLLKNIHPDLVQPSYTTSFGNTFSLATRSLNDVPPPSPTVDAALFQVCSQFLVTSSHPEILETSLSVLGGEIVALVRNTGVVDTQSCERIMLFLENLNGTQGESILIHCTWGDIE